MARKSAGLLPSRQKCAQERSYACVGVDTSMSSIAIVGIGFDALLDKTGVSYVEKRWYPDDEYFMRLGDAAHGADLVMDVLRGLWVIEPDRVFIALEEPWYFGATKKAESAWLKQQAEVAGAFKGSLVRWGFRNLFEINNQQWKKTLRDEGAGLLPSNKKDPDMKWKVKAWAMQAYSLPDLPDLVKSKTGSKIPRPESGFGAKAKAVQPDDIYDAAACCAWMQDEVARLGLV